MGFKWADSGLLISQTVPPGSGFLLNCKWTANTIKFSLNRPLTNQISSSDIHHASGPRILHITWNSDVGPTSGTVWLTVHDCTENQNKSFLLLHFMTRVFRHNITPQDHSPWRMHEATHVQPHISLGPEWDSSASMPRHENWATPERGGPTMPRLCHAMPRQLGLSPARPKARNYPCRAGGAAHTTLLKFLI